MYIRTKDGRIIDTTKYPEHPASWSVQASDYALTIKQSENLEELCDRFVAKTYDITQYWVEQRLECAKMYCGVEIIYGAIWTEWGLKYVAKMNENGELELI